MIEFVDSYHEYSFNRWLKTLWFAKHFRISPLKSMKLRPQERKVTPVGYHDITPRWFMGFTRFLAIFNYDKRFAAKSSNTACSETFYYGPARMFPFRHFSRQSGFYCSDLSDIWRNFETKNTALFSRFLSFLFTEF